MLHLSHLLKGSFVLISLLGLPMFYSCTHSPPASASAAVNDFVNKTWQLKSYSIKEVVGMLYRNKNQIKKNAADYLARGVSWYFQESGKFKIKEGELVSEGEWKADTKSKSLICNIITDGKKRQLVFSDVYLTDTSFTAELNTDNLTYLIEAVSGGR